MTAFQVAALILLAAIVVGAFLGALACRRGFRDIDRLVLEALDERPSSKRSVLRVNSQFGGLSQRTRVLLREMRER